MTTKRCSSCGSDNPAGSKFCGECGTPLARACPNCSTEVGTGAKFCGECGTKLEGARPPAPSPPEPPSSPGERRQVSVMFIDLVGSTELSGKLDPEDLRDLVLAYRTVCGKVIDRYGGFIANYVGDGLVVTFGYPTAHEDDAQRAAHTGLGIIEGMQHLNERHAAEGLPPLDVRIGVYTGLTIVGDMDHGGQVETMAIIGETPNIAARIEGLAPTGGLAVGDSTYRLLEGYFECEPLGRHTLKGVAEPMELYRVLAHSGAHSRLQAADSESRTPFVGREEEIRTLFEAWDSARGGAGRCILLSGEAGIGKSRLIEELKRHVAQDSSAWLTEAFCSPYFTTSALWPVVELLERTVLDYGPDDDPTQKMEKLEGFLAQYGADLDEAVPLMAGLLSLPLGADYAPLSLAPEMQKQKLMMLLGDILMARAERQPLLFVYDDLHWADPSSLQLLGMILERVPDAKILTVLAFRPEFEPPWPESESISAVELHRMDPPLIERMAQRLTGGLSLPAEVMAQVVDKTDGVPLFIEEMVKMILESGQLEAVDGAYRLRASVAELSIPESLQDLLVARLDRHSADRRVVQMGATIGRDFEHRLLEATEPLPAAQLPGELEVLESAELVERHEHATEVGYSFRHALLRDAAYQLMLKKQRRRNHEQIATTIERDLPATVEATPELLAQHWAAAHNRRKAIEYWALAGQKAFAKSANLEAISHYSNGLELVASLPEGPERVGHELNLQMGLGFAQIATLGYAAPQVGETLGRAREIGNQLPDSLALFPVYWGLWAYYIVRTEYADAFEMANSMLATATEAGDEGLILEADTSLGLCHFWTGEYPEARHHFEAGLSRYRLEEHGEHHLSFLQDPKMVCHCYLAWLHWMQGRPAEALRHARESIEHAEAIGHAYSIAYAVAFAAVFEQLQGRLEETLALSDRAHALSTEQGFPIWLADADMTRGWALARMGRVEEGRAQLQRGLDTWELIGASLWRTHQLGLLAEVQGLDGDPEAGLETIEQSLALVAQSGEDYYEPELHRLRGELLLQAGGEGAEAAAEASFLEAIAVAEEQLADSWRLRATMSLGRLLAARGRKAEALAALSEIYDGFDQGHETPDLLAAMQHIIEWG